MNKIYNTFSSIKVSDELKNKTYQKIIEHNYTNTRKTKHGAFYPSLAIASMVICLFLYNYEDITKTFKPKNNNIMTTEPSNYEMNYVMYNNHKYVLDNSIVIEKDMLGKEIDIISQDDNIGIYTVKSSNISIYNIKNISEKEQIAIFKDDKILVYKIKDMTNR